MKAIVLGTLFSCFALSASAAGAMPICTVQHVFESYCAHELEYSNGAKVCVEWDQADRGWAVKRDNEVLSYYNTEADALKVAHNLEAKKACAVLE